MPPRCRITRSACCFPGHSDLSLVVCFLLCRTSCIFSHVFDPLPSRHVSVAHHLPNLCCQPTNAVRMCGGASCNVSGPSVHPWALAVGDAVSNNDGGHSDLSDAAALKRDGVSSPVDSVTWSPLRPLRPFDSWSLFSFKLYS
jgi:hypothetical protein